MIILMKIQLIKLRLKQAKILINLRIFCLIVSQYNPKTSISKIKILNKQKINRILLIYCQCKAHSYKKRNIGDLKIETDK